MASNGTTVKKCLSIQRDCGFSLLVIELSEYRSAFGSRIRVCFDEMMGQLQRIALVLIFALGFSMPSVVVADERESELMAYLGKHGEWMTSAEFGPVWRPGPGMRDGDWHPYLNGQWLYTDRGWFWESRDDFGWLTCHFGRWQWIAEGGVGWIWVAGDEWASAWVAWRESEDAVGWGPLPPAAGGIVGGSPWETAVPNWQAFMFIPHQRLMAWDVGRYATRGDKVARAVTEEARLITVAEVNERRWSVSGPGLTDVGMSGEPIVVEFVERFPSDEEARQPFIGGEKIIAYAPRLDLGKAFAWVPGNLASLDVVLLEAERERLVRQHDAEREFRENQPIPRQPVYRVPEREPEVVESTFMREVVREPVIIYEQIVESPWYHGRPCPLDCGCPKCRPRPPIPEPYFGNEAQREKRARQEAVQGEQVQRQYSAQEAQRERQRAAQERARRGKSPNSPRVPLGPGL